MEELKEIEVTDTLGRKQNIKIITVLKNTVNNDEFVLYTFDDSDNVSIYASRLLKDSDGYKIGRIENEKDWNMIKDALSEMSL